MKEVFTNNIGNTVIFTDDGIAYKNSAYIKYYPYGSIQKIRISLGCLEIIDKEKADNGKNKASIFAVNGENKNRIKELIKFAEKQMATAKPAKAERKEIEDDDISLPKEIEDAIALATQYKSMEFRKRCAVCGHIFCYSSEDIKKNKELQKSALRSSLTGLAGALGGYYAASATNTQSADDQLARIVDYSKCPKCGSQNLVDATDEDIERNKAPQGTIVRQNSAADELKKFKELLDMGIITQEEFDAKKKQLLGL